MEGGAASDPLIGGGGGPVLFCKDSLAGGGGGGLFGSPGARPGCIDGPLVEAGGGGNPLPNVGCGGGGPRFAGGGGGPLFDDGGGGPLDGCSGEFDFAGGGTGGGVLLGGGPPGGIGGGPLDCEVCGRDWFEIWEGALFLAGGGGCGPRFEVDGTWPLMGGGGFPALNGAGGGSFLAGAGGGGGWEVFDFPLPGPPGGNLGGPPAKKKIQQKVWIDPEYSNVN